MGAPSPGWPQEWGKRQHAANAPLAAKRMGKKSRLYYVKGGRQVQNRVKAASCRGRTRRLAGGCCLQPLTSLPCVRPGVQRAAEAHLARCSPTSPPPFPSCRASRSPPTTFRTTARQGVVVGGGHSAAPATALRVLQRAPQGRGGGKPLGEALCCIGRHSQGSTASGTATFVPLVPLEQKRPQACSGHIRAGGFIQRLARRPLPSALPSCLPALLGTLTCTAPVLSHPRTSVQRYQ